jgi:hypothetical protein
MSMPASRARQTRVRHHRVHPGGAPGLGVVPPIEDEHPRGERHDLPGDEERHGVGGEGHYAEGDHEGQIGADVVGGLAGGADGIERDRGGADADEGQEEPGERVHRQLEAAERHDAVHSYGPREAQHARDADAGAGDAGRDGHRVGQARHQRAVPLAR